MAELLNKVQVRALVRNLIDDKGAKLWSGDDLDLLIEGCLDELWGDLLEAFPYLRWTEVTATIASGGYIDLADTNTFARPYKVLKIVKDGQTLAPAESSEVSFAAGVVTCAESGVWAPFGARIYIFPFDAGKTVTVHYNSLPEPFTSISPGPELDDELDDASLLVEWPDGHHMAYVYDVASKALEKGDREDSSRLGKRAEVAMYRLKARLRKFYPGPITPTLTDEGMNWGSTT